MPTYSGAMVRELATVSEQGKLVRGLADHNHVLGVVHALVHQQREHEQP